MTATTMMVEEFKLTELGPLPPEWEVVRLGDVAKVTSGGSAPQGKQFFDGQNPFVRVQHLELESDTIRRWDLITDEAVNKCGLRLYSKGTIVFPKSGASIYLEKRAILPIDAYIVSHLCAVISQSPLVDQDFLFYYLRFVRLSEQKAEGYPTLNLTEIKERKIAWPPLPEQKKIAYVLSTVQTVIEKTEAVIKASRDLRKSIVRYLFTYGPAIVSEAENVPLKETEIGVVPEGWPVKTLQENVESIEYGYSISIPSEENLYGIPIISTADITKDGSILYNRVRKINPPKRLTERLLLKDGDVLFNWRNAPELVGKTAIYEEQLQRHICASFIMRIRTTVDLSNSFLCYLLNYYRQIGVFLRLARRAVNQANYNRNEISVLRVPLPPLHVQQGIARILSSVDRKIEGEESKKRSLEALFDTLLSKLLTGRKRVDNLEVLV